MLKGLKYTTRLFFLFYLVTCCLKTIQAQSFLVRTYDTHDGLPSSTVYSIAQDSTGDMWFATTGGIVSYDGVIWEKYTVKEKKLFGGFFRLLIDNKGIIWNLGYYKKFSICSLVF